jgi:hypothetical protein
MNIPVVYISLIDDPHAMKKMLAHARGQRKIPVIVDGEEVTVGFKEKGEPFESGGWRPPHKKNGRSGETDLAFDSVERGTEWKSSF